MVSNKMFEVSYPSPGPLPTSLNNIFKVKKY